MSSVVEIEEALRKLPAEELVKFREWFADFDAERWDHQLRTDADSGRLDALAQEAIEDLKNGRTRNL